MSWIMAGTAAVGAIKGTMDAKSNKKRQAKNDAFRKQAIAYSPWTKMGDPGSPNVGNTDATSGFLGGAMQGAMVGNAFGGMKTGGDFSKVSANGSGDVGGLVGKKVGMVDPGMNTGGAGLSDPTKNLYGGIFPTSGMA